MFADVFWKWFINRLCGVEQWNAVGKKHSFYILKRPDALFCFFNRHPVPHDLLYTELLRCTPGSVKNRSLAYLLHGVLDCWSCDEVGTQQSRNWSTYIAQNWNDHLCGGSRAIPQTDHICIWWNLTCLHIAECETIRVLLQLSCFYYQGKPKW